MVDPVVSASICLSDGKRVATFSSVGTAQLESPSLEGVVAPTCDASTDIADGRISVLCTGNLHEWHGESNPVLLLAPNVRGRRFCASAIRKRGVKAGRRG